MSSTSHTSSILFGIENRTALISSTFEIGRGITTPWSTILKPINIPMGKSNSMTLRKGTGQSNQELERLNFLIFRKITSGKQEKQIFIVRIVHIAAFGK